jgi:hypothetical protein
MSEQSYDDRTQHLQNVVDTVKTMNLIQNPHSLTPPQMKPDDTGREIAIIEGLKTKDEDMFKLYLEARGLEEQNRTFIQVNHPYLNVRGAYKFVQIIFHIVGPTEFSNFHEEEIPARLVHCYERDITEIKINQEKYELETCDFNWIDSIYQSAIDAAYHKAKGGKFINVVGKTYDEKGMFSLLNPQQKKENLSFADRLDKLNPFTKK